MNQLNFTLAATFAVDTLGYEPAYSKLLIPFSFEKGNDASMTKMILR